VPTSIQLIEEGCEPHTESFERKFRTGNFVLSVISWGLIGIGVDLGTGASYKPEHTLNQAVTKMSAKNFNFNIQYPECPASSNND